MRFETAPGRQLQIDFGTTTVPIGAERVTIHLFVATLGFSRRAFVRVFDHERQSAWLDGLEGAFQYFGGLPEEVLLDNARALVEHHDPTTRMVVFNPRLLAFARYWGFQPRACAPYRARTKGKDERGVGYVKHNAIAGRTLASWAALEAHLSEWSRTVADVRIHGTTGEPPLERFQRAEATALRPLNGRPPFHWTRELTRRVHTDSCVEVDTNHYSVPWRLIGETVTVRVRDDRMGIFHAGAEVARHLVAAGRRQRGWNRPTWSASSARPVAGGPRPSAVPAPSPSSPRPHRRCYAPWRITRWRREVAGESRRRSLTPLARASPIDHAARSAGHPPR